MAIYPVILAGGGGKRLWPLSDPQEPKPFLKLGDRPSLFSATVTRVLHWAPPANIRVVCGADHARLVHRELSALAIGNREAITVEPTARNTGPAVLLQAMKLKQTDPDAVMVVLPADHVIEPVAQFQAAIQQAVNSVADKLILFGILPQRPETGYGYIETEDPAKVGHMVAVKQFVEKPDLAQATAYLETGKYLWNAGIFIFKAAVICEEFRLHQPLMHDKVTTYLAGDCEAFAQTPPLSIDVAVMEPSHRTAVIPVDFFWNDVGNWSAVASLFPQDAAGNSRVGQVQIRDCENSFLLGDDALVGGLGIKDLVVVAARNQVLVAPKSRSSELKMLVEQLGEAAMGNTTHRPWGSFVVLDQTPGSLTKRIDILPGSRTSLQKHRHRQEHWVVLRGTLKVTRDDEVFFLEPGQSTSIPQGAIHRLENTGETMVSLIEVQMGDHLSEDDIVRFQDDYGRKTKDRSSVAG